jgi:hypothetical protein
VLTAPEDPPASVEADAGVGEEPIEDVGPPTECFPEQRNDNLEAAVFTAGPRGDQGLVCGGDGASTLDGEVAGLAYGGGAPVLVGEEMVTACLVADLGQRCTMSSHLGVGVSVSPVGEICGDPGGVAGQEQCAELLACGDMPAVEVSVFAGDRLDDMRFLAHVGNCGAGQSVHGLNPMTALADAADLESVRYLMVCRPAASCGADDGNVAVDALYLTWRD